MLELRRIHKSFDGKVALSDISFKVSTGEIVALLGPSGSGKSTLLSVVAGLEKADRGQVRWDGRNLTDLPPHRRKFGLMFQDFALFPHRNVFGNVAFGLQMASSNAAQVHQRVNDMLQLVGLSGLEHRDVSSLSGGEQQRVALARALAPQPRLLMLDEPLGSLDRALRTRLLEELGALLRKAGQTSLYVTHDQEEAYAIADRIVLLRAGRIEQVAAPEELYRWPATAFVARFLGMNNLLPARIVKTGRHTWLETALGKLPASKTRLQGEVVALLRPDAIKLGRSMPVKLNGKLLSKRFRGRNQQAIIMVDETQLVIELPSSTVLPKSGARLSLSFDPRQAIQVFSRE
ncbi:MAG: ABC transporter ATP-binding protein [Anaerolineales bacterium]